MNVKVYPFYPKGKYSYCTECSQWRLCHPLGLDGALLCFNCSVKKQHDPELKKRLEELKQIVIVEMNNDKTS
jgi:hypothetical protein